MERSDFHFATKLTGKQKKKQTNSYTKQKKMKKMKQKKI